MPASRRKGKKIRTGQLIAQTLLSNPELLEQAENWDAYMYDQNSPSLKTRRARIKLEFLDILRPLRKISDDVSDDDAMHTLFAPDVVIKNVQLYLFAIAQSPLIKGRIAEHITAGTLRQRLAGLWWFAAWVAGKRVGEIWTEWSHQLFPAVHKAAVQFDLGTRKWQKAYFGVPELRLLFEVTW
jgi:hypothetical protein